MTIRVILLGGQDGQRAPRPQIHQIHHVLAVCRAAIVARRPRLWPNISFVAAKVAAKATPFLTRVPDQSLRPPRQGGAARVSGWRATGVVVMFNATMLNVGCSRRNRMSTRPTAEPAPPAGPGKRLRFAIVTRTPQTVLLSPPARSAAPAARHSRSCGDLHANIYAVNRKTG